MKIIIFLSLLMLILTGCSVYPIFVGESDNWKGEYSTNSENSCDGGSYILHFKEGTRDSELHNIEVIIDDGIFKLSEDKLKGSTLQFSRCNRINEDRGIDVRIKWDDVNEETFILEKK